MDHKPYRLLLLMVALHFVAMYFLMYAMVDAPANIFHNLNQVYMAAIMTTPMIVIELLLMREMYPDKMVNLVVIAVGVALFIIAFAAIRQQGAIGDEQFLRSMIPHHAGAVLMCGEASIEDAEIEELCTQIVDNQQREIAQMKAILARLG